MHETEDKNHTVKYLSGSTDILHSFSHDLSAYFDLQDDDDLVDSDDESIENEEGLSNLFLSEFRSVVAKFCLEKVPTYAYDKKVIGMKSIILGSTKKTLSMEPLKSTLFLRNFILDKVKKMKANKEKDLRVRLSFGVAMPDDEIVDVADLEEDADEEDMRFSQMEMNEPRLKQLHQEMSRASKVGLDAVEAFLSKEQKRDGPMKHGFTEEHSNILFGKLCSFEVKIQEYDKEQDANIIFDLLNGKDVKKFCYGLKPGKGKYPPIAGSSDPPKAKQWADANNKSLDESSERDRYKNVQFDVMNKQMKITSLLMKNLTKRQGVETNPNHQVTNPNHQATNHQATNLNHHEKQVIINLGRARKGNMTYVSVPVGNKHPAKLDMKLSYLQDKLPRWFKKKDADSALKMTVSLDANGSKYYIYESEFSSNSFQDVIDKCNFDSTVIPIEICLTEEKDED